MCQYFVIAEGFSVLPVIACDLCSADILISEITLYQSIFRIFGNSIYQYQSVLHKIPGIGIPWFGRSLPFDINITNIFQKDPASFKPKKTILDDRTAHWMEILATLLRLRAQPPYESWCFNLYLLLIKRTC